MGVTISTDGSIIFVLHNPFHILWRMMILPPSDADFSGHAVAQHLDGAVWIRLALVVYAGSDKLVFCFYLSAPPLIFTLYTASIKASAFSSVLFCLYAFAGASIRLQRLACA